MTSADVTLDTSRAAAVVGQRKSSVDDVPRLAPQHLALQDLRGKKGSCRKGEARMEKKARDIALILIKTACATSQLPSHGKVTQLF